SAWGSSGSGNGQFQNPTGVAVDVCGNVYITDASNNRIQEFDENGMFVTTWGGVGSGNGQFNYPYSVAVDGNGNVYVADTNNNRIEKFVTGTPVPLSITVLVNGDVKLEPDENLFVNLSNPVNATITDPQGIGTISNNDVRTVSIDDINVVEGNSGTTSALFT